MKIAIIGGAGGIGSAIGFYLAVNKLARELVLIDVKENLVKSHAMDMGQAVAEFAQTTVTAGDWESLSGADVVVLAASSVPHNDVEKNLKIVESAGRQITRYCPAACVITATNPIDVLNYALHQVAGIPARQLIGYSRNDSVRLRSAIANLLRVPGDQVQALVIGEHGSTMVPVFSQASVRGQRVELSAAQRTEVSQFLKNWLTAYVQLESGRTNFWTSAVGIGQLVTAMAQAKGEVVPCSAILEGQYGIHGVSLGVPVVLDPHGVVRVVELPLSPDELEALRASARKVAQVISAVLARRGSASQQL